jgi:chemosensory pili system protein ChpA (sensor histidine kinase/response regulator)
LFNALVTTYLFKDDLKLVMCLISLKEGATAGLKSRHIESTTQRIIAVFKEIQSLSPSSELIKHTDLGKASRTTFYLIWPESVAALKSTMLSSLSDIEPQLDTALAAKDWEAVVDSIRNVLQPIKAIFLFLNDAEGVVRVDLLAKFGNELEDGQTTSDFLDISTFVQRWIDLGMYIDSKITKLGEQFDSPTFLREHAETADIHVTFDASLDTELQKIFVSEAIDRLRLLREHFEQFSQSKVNMLATHTALEAHALAGSSATVGNHSMHQSALALEQLIEQIIFLSADQQRAYLPELLENLSILERELGASYGEQALPIAPVVNVITPLSPVKDCNDVESSNEFFDELILSQSNKEIVNVPSSETFILQSDVKYSEILVPETPELPAKFLHEELSISVDPELHAIFIEEASELLPQLRSLLNQWVANPAESSHPTDLLRLLHTLKGSSRMAGELALGEAFHELEHRISQLSLRRSDESSEITLLQKEVCQLLMDAGLIEEELSVEAERSVAIESTGASPGSNQLLIKRATSNTKLRVDVIERASGTVAELLVNAMRSTEDCRRQKQLVIDLADNLSRLRSQLRELELQSEASISAQSAPGALGFDPLEFDRFTRLQELTRMTAESMADLSDLQRSLARQTDASLTLLATQTRYARSLQSDLYRASTQIFASVENRFRQLVRQVATELGRDVEFEFEGGALEIDRAYLENLNGPLSHLLRNAIVHGIEPMEEREQFGKPCRGLVSLKLSDHGHELRLQVTDDGRGLDYERIRERAIANGLISASTHVDTESLTQWIFEPGFSTAEQVTGLAGRGIGMDAVKAAVVAMGGALKVDSQSGLGTSIIIALPKASSTQKILLVSDGYEQIALPSAMVQQVLQITTSNLKQAVAEGFIKWQGNKITLCSLSDLLRESPNKQNLGAHNNVIILRQLDQWLAIWINEILGHHEVIVKPPGVQLIGVPGLVGAALLPDGGVLLVMNLLQRQLKLRSSALFTKALETPKSMVIPPLVLVVDDSLTVRRISQRMLEKNGYAVIVAKHGAEALEKVRDQTPAAFLLDIEMPTMDGFELLSRLRADDRFSAVPIAMITSRIAERHRHHALQLGANAYFGKPYREQELLEWLAYSLTTYCSNTECNSVEQGDAI